MTRLVRVAAGIAVAVWSCYQVAQYTNETRKWSRP